MLLDQDIPDRPRLEWVLNQRGQAAMLTVLQRELGENPRLYVKSSTANNPRHGVELGER